MLQVNENLIFTIINLLILFVAMRIFLFKPVQKIIKARQDEADQVIEEAKASRQEADNLKEEYQKTMDGAEEDRRRLMIEARKNADVEYNRIISEAKSEANTVRNKAVNEANLEKAQILRSAEAEIAQMVVDATSKAMGQTGKETDSAIYDSFLDKAGDKA